MNVFERVVIAAFIYVPSVQTNAARECLKLTGALYGGENTKPYEYWRGGVVGLGVALGIVSILAIILALIVWGSHKNGNAYSGKAVNPVA